MDKVEIVHVRRSRLEKESYNDNNHHDLSPYKFRDGSLVLDRKYYATIQNSWVEKKLREQYNIIVEDDVLYDNMDNIDDDKDFWKVYKTIFDWYDAGMWYKASDIPIERVEIYDKEIEYLERLTRSNIIGQPSPEEVHDNLKDLKKRIAEALKKVVDSEVGAFVKLSQHSMKHNYPPVECICAQDVMDHIFGGTKTLGSLAKQKDRSIPLALYFKKWDETISGHSEFRVIIEDNEVVGICQQHLYEVYPIMGYIATIADDLYKDHQKLWDEISAKLPADCKYPSAVIDTYVDANMKPHLVEINGLGYWGPAGAALYKWKESPPRKDKKEFRLTIGY